MIFACRGAMHDASGLSFAAAHLLKASNLANFIAATF
jgi:hypothetical protein